MLNLRIILALCTALLLGTVAEASRRAPRSVPAQHPDIAQRQASRDKVVRRMKLLAENPGMRKRDGSAVPYPDCGGGDTSNIKTADFMHVNFTPSGSALASISAGTPQVCVDKLYMTNTATIAYLRTSTCDIYAGFVSGSLVRSAGDNAIFRNMDCATAVAAYGMPAAGDGVTPSCCNRYYNDT